MALNLHLVPDMPPRPCILTFAPTLWSLLPALLPVLVLFATLPDASSPAPYLSKHQSPEPQSLLDDN